MAYNIEYEMFKVFEKSSTKQKCINYLQSITNNKISFLKYRLIRNEYSTLFVKETKNSQAYQYAYNTYIPYLLDSFNIVLEEPIENHVESTYDNHPDEVKPYTLVDGWVLYIVIMLLSSLFYARIALWTLFTVGFILWRKIEIIKYN